MIQRRKPLKRSVKPIARRARVNRKRTQARRVSVVRDRAYLDELGWSYCEIGLKIGSEGCSMISDAAHGPVNGMGSKGPDSEAIALCRTHHREQHRIGWPAFEKKYDIDRAAIAKENYRKFREEIRAT